MLKLKTKKYAFFASCALLSLLLLILSGCDASSDPKVYYQATGSWEGTIDGKSVRGIIAPDGRYHLAVVDANGDFIPGAGEYVGTVSMVDKENNIGRMTLAFLRPPAAGEPPVSAVILTPVSFILTGSSLSSADAPYNLSRTPNADGPGTQSDVAGRWSLSVNETTPDITNLVVDSAGNLSGNDGDACQYSGTLKLIDPAWNIFELNLKFSDYLGKDCKDDTLLTYEGLAMVLPVENNRKHLWLASTVWTASGTRTGTYIKNLAATINVAPVAKMTANAIELQESEVPTTIEVKKLSDLIQLDGQGKDGNEDPLTYRWIIKNPLNETLNITSTESVVSFSPGMDGDFTLNLKVYDDIYYSNEVLSSDEIVRNISVELAPDRYVDCGNGTVLDTLTKLFWLKNAGCEVLHSVDNGWLDLVTAKARVENLAHGGGCSLEDFSETNDWRLPSNEEFAGIINTAYVEPALANGAGTDKWTPGDVFLNVGDSPYAFITLYLYWTSSLFVDDTLGSYVDLANSGNPLFDTMDADNINAVWPVRDKILADESNALCKDLLNYVPK